MRTQRTRAGPRRGAAAGRGRPSAPGGCRRGSPWPGARCCPSRRGRSRCSRARRARRARRRRSPSCRPRARRSSLRAPLASSVQPSASDVLGDGVRDEIADAAAVGDTAADLRGRDVQARHVEEHGRRVRRGSSRAAARRRPPGPTSSRAATASVASSSTVSGSRHDGSPRAMSPPTMKVRSSSGVRACSARSVSTVYDGPPRRDLEVADVEALVARARRAGRAPGAPARPGSRSASLCGGCATGVSSTRSSSSCAAASDAQTRWARCGGLKVPPRMPMRATRR